MRKDNRIAPISGAADVPLRAVAEFIGPRKRRKADPCFQIDAPDVRTA
jgi:hypothetical protein